MILALTLRNRALFETLISTTDRVSHMLTSLCNISNKNIYMHLKNSCSNSFRLKLLIVSDAESRVFGVIFYHFLITNFVFQITSYYNYFSQLIWALQKDGGGNRIHITHLISYPVCETQGSGNTNYKCLY